MVGYRTLTVSSAITPPCIRLYSTTVPSSAGGGSRNGETTTIPYVETIFTKNGVKAVNAMYNSLPDDSPVKSYLTKNCSFLLKPLTGSFTLPLSLIKEALYSNDKSVQLKDNWSNAYSKGKHLVGTSGVYLFTDAEGVAQCGSSLTWETRLQLHFQVSRGEMKKEYKDRKPFYRNSLSRFIWTPVFITTNHEIAASKLMNLTPQEKYILICFTQLHLRTVEQALHNYLKPRYWTGKYYY